MMKTDILIIGAGITGTAVARELSRFRAHITVIERGADIAEGATKANSGIVHAGYDALPGTKKALFNVRGAAVYGNLCASLGVPYRRCGALVVGFQRSYGIDERHRPAEGVGRHPGIREQVH
jgi:glycerol-3-phosphate dehydrogenase